ncbi:MAG: MFS transporter [Brasilonema octagenarum HA4186-MV1]|jgi:MFS family permease|uniref:Arabinose transporter permease n=1 Tax=Brasilonema sennae CENA114 TaxID=415709 RepID=A0A856MC25_9CYAN|nr:MFS transporter [Brasilonema sennae]MBW4627945.1 MFS transporter [Brasilonema octagenarum HA4186-MV1]QDL08733.1 arabinose transporter permease [Brasilonema sennae CENA114]QDL15090.1 arabinose transporter permease [Brasilonema octagenarum UFV-E1]
MNQSSTRNQPKSSTNIFQDKNFYIINLVTVVGILGGTLYNPALPTIQDKIFHVTPEEASWISTLFQLPGAVITPIFGILADVLGRKQVLIPSLLVFALGAGLSGWASNFTTNVTQQFRIHLGGRFVQGVGAASLEPLQLTVLSDLYQGRKLGAAMAFNAALIGMSGALFPLIGGILGQINWQYTFLPGLVAIPIAFLVLVTLRLPRRPQNTEKFQLKSYLQSTWNSINNRHVLGLLFAVMSLFLLQTLCLTYIPFLATKNFQTTDLQNGIILTSMSIALAFFAAQLGRLTQSLSEIKLIKLSFILFAVALLILPIIPNFWLIFIPMILLGAAQGIALPSSQALLGGLSAQDSRAGFMAVNTSIMSWGQTLGPFLGSLAITFWGLPAVFYSSAVFAVISFAVFNYFLTTKIFNFTAKTVQVELPVNTDETTLIPPQPASPTNIQTSIAQLLHVQTNRVFELPDNFQVINIGKSSNRIIPEVDLSDLPSSELVSRVHAQIRFDGNEYYIQDLNSSNGTYINNYPVIPGVWYKLKPGIRIDIGRRDTITFMFALDE